MAVGRMRISCWITKVINTDSEYVMLISSRLQQLLQECASMLRTSPILFSPDHWKNIRMNLIRPAALISVQDL